MFPWEYVKKTFFQGTQGQARKVSPPHYKILHKHGSPFLLYNLLVFAYSFNTLFLGFWKKTHGLPPSPPPPETLTLNRAQEPKMRENGGGDRLSITYNWVGKSTDHGFFLCFLIYLELFGKKQV